MSLTHTRIFRVRHYECDARGHAYHANYLRFMQETAFDASAAAGYDTARYEAMGRFWLVRETKLDVFRSLFYDEEIQVKTWVANFRRVHSQRAYELSLAGTGEMVARGVTDWAFLDSTTGHPVAIPDEMIAAFITTGANAQPGPRDRFPSPPPAPPGAFRARRRVEWRDLDPAGHVNNAVYLAYFEDSTMLALSTHGWPAERLEAQGLALQARSHHIDYRQPALLDQDLEIITWFSGVEPAGAISHFELRCAGDSALIARGRTQWGIDGLDRGEPRPIPQALLADLAPVISGAAAQCCRSPRK